MNMSVAVTLRRKSRVRAQQDESGLIAKLDKLGGWNWASP